MEEEDLIGLKKRYNYNLKRFYNGCKYCETHEEERDKWIPELVRIVTNIEVLLATIKECIPVNEKEVLEGFELNETI